MRSSGGSRSWSVRGALPTSMRAVLGLGLILGASTAGRLVSNTFALPIGGAPLGLILLTAVLLRWPAVHQVVKLPAAALTASLGLLFVPFVVDVRFRWSLVAENWPTIACAIAVSSVVGLTVTAALVDRLELSAPEAQAAPQQAGTGQ